MQEVQIEGEVVAWAQRHGWFTRKLQWVGRVGAPDRLFIKGARVVFIEFKTATGRLSAWQRREIEAMRAAGAEVHVVRTVEQGKEVLGCD